MKSINNKGFTLIETLLCFVILGILMVVASQLIHSSTEVYYYNRTMSYGIQASQIVSTEIRGEIEDALPIPLINNPTYYFYLNTSDNSFEFVNSNGIQVKYVLENISGRMVLNRYSFKAYDNERLLITGENEYPDEPNKSFDSKYIGMGYEIKSIKFEKFKRDESASGEKLGSGDSPVLVMKITVGNNQYGEYECTEYISLYNFYGIDSFDNPISDKIYIYGS